MAGTRYAIDAAPCQWAPLMSVIRWCSNNALDRFWPSRAGSGALVPVQRFASGPPVENSARSVAESDHFRVPAPNGALSREPRIVVGAGAGIIERHVDDVIVGEGSFRCRRFWAW